MESPPTGKDQAALADAQLRKLQLEIKKLSFEVESLEDKRFQAEKIMKFVPLVTVIIAVAGFWFTVHQYNEQQANAATKQAADREQALLKPVWDKRLELYFSASEAAAVMALSKDKTERDKAESKILQLYAGPLIIVEDPDVEAAMIKVYKCVTGEDSCDDTERQRRSQVLASRARDSIGKSYNIRLGDLKGKY